MIPAEILCSFPHLDVSIAVSFEDPIEVQPLRLLTPPFLPLYLFFPPFHICPFVCSLFFGVPAANNLCPLCIDLSFSRLNMLKHVQ